MSLAQHADLILHGGKLTTLVIGCRDPRPRTSVAIPAATTTPTTPTTPAAGDGGGSIETEAPF